MQRNVRGKGRFSVFDAAAAVGRCNAELVRAGDVKLKIKSAHSSFSQLASSHRPSHSSELLASRQAISLSQA